MNFPERAVALEWVGKTIIDRDSLAIGSCTDVFLDDATGLTEWVCAEVAGEPVFIPAVGAVESSGDVQVVVSRADIAAAPPVSGTEHISADEEVQLYRHYGIPYSRDASATVLPVGAVEPSAPDVISDAVDPEMSVTPPVAHPATADPVPGRVVVESVAANPASAGPVAVRPLEAGPIDAEPLAVPPVARPLEAGPIDAEPLAVPPVARKQPVPATGQDLFSGSALPAGGRGRVGPALAGLVAVAVAAGLVSRARHRRQQRAATRTERLADRRQAASVALGARIGPVAASASRYLDTTRQAVRRRVGTEKASVDVPVATLEVTAARRAS